MDNTKKLRVVFVQEADKLRHMVEVKDEDSGIALVDSLFAATGKACALITETGKTIYEKQSPKDMFLRQPKEVQENALMETAMRIMDIYDDMSYAHNLNPDKTDSVDFMKKLSVFRDWAREYEYKFYGTEGYETFWLESTENYFTPLLKKEYGNEEEDV